MAPDDDPNGTPKVSDEPDSVPQRPETRLSMLNTGFSSEEIQEMTDRIDPDLLALLGQC
jgi:hypothetical protein